jgi:hypothetical protein
MDRSQRVGAKRKKRLRHQKNERLNPRDKGSGPTSCPGKRQQKDTDRATGYRFREDKSTTEGMRGCVRDSEKLGFLK